MRLTEKQIAMLQAVEDKVESFVSTVHEVETLVRLGLLLPRAEHIDENETVYLMMLTPLGCQELAKQRRTS